MNPEMLSQMLAQLGGGSPAEAQPPPPESVDGDWLTAAINAVHGGMVQERDPKQVSLLGAILNQLTTFQANRMNQGASG